MSISSEGAAVFASGNANNDEVERFHGSVEMLGTADRLGGEFNA
ncbi:hypothetical protein [Ensifer sp. MJa1]